MRLIDADALWKKVRDFRDTAPEEVTKRKYTCNAILLALVDEKEVPTIEAVPVVHGRWVGTHDGWFYSYSCSECGAEALTKEDTMHDQVCSAYCPNCGARMDGE